MNHKGPQKHSPETIRAAIARLESGARLSTIARELNVPKNTVKYWLDHSNKYLSDEKNQSLVAVRIKDRLARDVWDIIFSSLKILKGKLDNASPRDLVQIISELFDRQAQFGAFNGKSRVPDKVMEVSEEVKITVQRFLEKQSVPSEAVVDLPAAETSLGGPTPEQPSADGVTPPKAGASAPISTENKANG